MSEVLKKTVIYSLRRVNTLHVLRNIQTGEMLNCCFLGFAEKYTQYVYNPGEGRWGTPRKARWLGLGDRFPKTLPCSSPKPVTFATLFMTGAAGTVSLNISYEGLLS